MSYGAAAHGSGAFGSGTAAGARSFSFSRVVFSSEGGEQVTVGGLDDGVYLVYFGPYGTTDDLLCYSGVSGQGNNITVLNGSATFWTPPARKGTAGFLFRKITGVGEDEIYTDQILVVTGFVFRHKILAYRSLFNSRYRTGYRSSADVPLQL